MINCIWVNVKLYQCYSNISKELVFGESGISEFCDPSRRFVSMLSSDKSECVFDVILKQIHILYPTFYSCKKQAVNGISRRHI